MMTTQYANILQTALSHASKLGYSRMTKARIASSACVSTGTINYHFKTMVRLRAAVMQYAVDHEILDVVAQGLAGKHPIALEAPESLRKKAARSLSS